MEKELIIKARRVNLGEYLLSKGEPLKRNGTRYRHIQHDSLVFTGNSFYWNGRSEKGNSIDFLMLYFDMDFKTAVNELLEYVGISDESELMPQKKQDFRFSEYRLELSTARVEYYLSVVRGIDRILILDFISHGYIYQEYGTKNIIFPMYDETHKVVGAEIRGSTKDGRYKGIGKNSKYGYGFNLVYGEPETVYCFESAIDLLSYIEYSIRTHTPLDRKCFVSMGGLKENVVHFMSRLYSPDIVLCVDNDTAGRNFSARMKLTYPKLVELYPPNYKDWNEYLRNKKLPEDKR